MPTWDQTLPEAADFTRQNRDAYIAFVQELKAELGRIRHEAGCAGLIYSTYSRSDKQAGEELKETWKIAKKLHERRSTHPASAVSDIHDIVGLTVVVNFPSDREIVAAYISRPGVLRCALVYQQEGKEENGYHAIHLKVKGATIDRDFLRAEIQIKTMLHDGWGAKTHDLTYKPEGSIDAALLRHMNILGDVLRQLDDQSELIKDSISRKWHDDRRYRAVARESLFRSLISATPGHDVDLAAIAKDVQSNSETLARVSLDDPMMKAIHTRIQTLQERIGWGRDLCQLTTFLASLRPSRDLKGYALNAVTKWMSSCTDLKDRLACLNLRSLTYYALGNFEDAVATARETTKLIEASGNDEMKRRAMGNLAYYISEFVVSMPKPDPDLSAEAKDLSARALPPAGTSPSAKILDTRGAVLIALGDSESEVREGLQMCQQAISTATPDEKAVAEAYFKLHERRAFRRLLEWD